MPVRIQYDNKTLQTSLFFVGNSVYLPSGFAPSRRTQMDDGLLDVRILETGRRFGRLRILVALALGRLTRSPLYHEMRVPEFAFTAVDGPTVLAHDGEIGTEFAEATLQRAIPGASGVSSASRDRPPRRHQQQADGEIGVAQSPSGQTSDGMVHIEHDAADPDEDDDQRAQRDEPAPQRLVQRRARRRQQHQHADHHTERVTGWKRRRLSERPAPSRAADGGGHVLRELDERVR